MDAKIVVLPGDGIGPGVTDAAVQVLEYVASKFNHKFTFTKHLIGGISIDQHGVALTDETLAACKTSNAVLLGAVGGPKWDNPTAAIRPEQGLLGLRKGLGLYANLRPIKMYPSLISASPLKPELLQDVDMLVVRELTSGLYFGEPKGRKEIDGHVHAVDTLDYADYEIERIVELAFRLAERRKKKVTSVDKANVLESSRLWRQIATEIGKKHSGFTLEHMLVDTASMRLITSPKTFDVVVTENTFGDILTDEASVLVGSMGMLPSASLGVGDLGVYEPNSWICAGYCRKRNCESYRHHFKRCHAAAVLAAFGKRGARHRSRCRVGDCGRLPHTRSRRNAFHRNHARSNFNTHRIISEIFLH